MSAIGRIFVVLFTNPISKRAVTAIVASLIALLFPGISEIQRAEIVALAIAIIAGYTIRDPGKSLRPAVTALSVSGGVPQVIDDEDPR